MIAPFHYKSNPHAKLSGFTPYTNPHETDWKRPIFHIVFLHVDLATRT